MAITAEQFKEAARKAAAAGDIATAKSLIAKAQAADGGFDAIKSGLSGAFQSAAAPRAGPPMPEHMAVRARTKDYYTQNPEGAVTALSGGAVRGGSFGFGDELMAGVRAISPNITYDQALGFERGRLDAAREEHPIAAYGGEIGGAIMAPAAAVKGATAGARILSGARAGAIGGAAYGFGAGENGFIPRAKDALTTGTLGAGLGAGASAFGSLIKKAMEAKALDRAIKAAAKNAPTTEALRAAGNAAYKTVDGAGVSINPAALQPKLGGIADDLRGEGVALDVGGKVFPAARGVMEAADSFTTGRNSVPFKDLDVLRRYMGAAAASNPANKADARLATKAVTSLDDIVDQLQPQDIDAGDLQALQTMLPKAREIWTKMSKSQRIDDAIEASQDYLSGSASGLRNQFARILRNPKLIRGFSEAEKRALRNVVRGTIPEQALHLAAGGLGRLMTMAGGFAGGGIPGAAAGTGLSFGLQKASEKIAMKNAEIARGIVANGGLKSAPQVSALPALFLERLLMGGTRPTLPVFAPEVQGLLTPR